MSQKADVVLIGEPKKLIVNGLSGPFNLHVLPKGNDAEAIIAKVGANVRAAAVTGAPDTMRTDVIKRFPKLEVISSFGVGYDNVDFKYAADNKIVVCNTPEVLNEEDADTALGPRGIVINMSRGTVVDDAALIKALKEKKIYSAGLDVFVNEPEVPKEYLEMDNIVLFPHLGSSTVFTR